MRVGGHASVWHAGQEHAILRNRRNRHPDADVLPWRCERPNRRSVEESVILITTVRRAWVGLV